MEKSRAYLPQLKISENDIASAEYDVKLQKSNFYPSLSLSTGISTGYSGNNQSDNLGWGTQLWHGLGENVGLNLSIPIYQRSQVRNSVKQAQLRVQQAELTKQEVSYQIDQELQQYYLDVLSAQNDYRVAEARKEAYEALIGKLYAASAGRCSGEDLPLACCWAAADKYAKAVAVDPSCANEANNERAKLRYPAKDELFKRGLKAGDSYRVGCWIQESTTVR